MQIIIDADSCPVKQEVYRVAERYNLSVTLVSNIWMRTPPDPNIELVVVNDYPDAADDWIVEHLTPNDIVISADIPLAARCIEKNARVLSSRGRLFTETDIGDALATRDLMVHLRDQGAISGGAPAFNKQDRSRFLQRLDGVIQTIRRETPNQKP